MDLKDIMLREISQRKTNTLWSHLHVESKKPELTETENGLVAVRGRGEWWANGGRWSKGINSHLHDK